MLAFDKWHFPDGENHLQGWMTSKNERIDGRLTYQYHKYSAAMKWVKDKTLAVDVGSHVGLWAYFLARDFEHVACFEPMPEHQACWHVNMAERTNAELFTCALGRDFGEVAIETRTKGSSGDTGVKSGKGVDLKPLDHFNFENVGLIKIDTEGYEMDVLEGAVETIIRCKPCLIVEQKGMETGYGRKKQEAVSFLKGLGADLREEISGDFILSWDA